MGFWSTTIKNIDRSTNIKYPEHITITEKRAPTDESIRLYDEYLEKTKQSVLGSFKLETTYVNAVVVAFTNPNSCADLPNIDYRIIFSLNNKREEIRFNIDGYEYYEMNRMSPQKADEKLIRTVVQKISKTIAVRMLQQIDLKDIGVKQLNG